MAFTVSMESVKVPVISSGNAALDVAANVAIPTLIISGGVLLGNCWTAIGKAAARGAVAFGGSIKESIEEKKEAKAVEKAAATEKKEEQPQTEVVNPDGTPAQ